VPMTAVRENVEPGHGPVVGRTAKAASTYFSKVAASDALDKKQIAPSRNARARADSSGNAVMKMIGTVRPWLRKRVCSSRPVMSGILTSVITHDVSSKTGECKKAAADSNAWTV